MNKDEIDGTCSIHGKMRNLYKIVDGEFQKTRSFGIARRIWDNNSKINLKNK
jgi:hypothetical protein